WLPAGGSGPLGGGSFLERLPYLIMPSIVVGLINMASWMRYVRSSMLEVLGSDFVRTARAKGLRERTVTYKHALKNCLLPLITLVGLAFPGLMGGAVVTESVFAYPGVGRLLYESIMGSDYPVAMGALLVLAVSVAVFTAVSDLIYTVVDPRVSIK
ncbi:MAG TPA: ABC transporter permease, partial [Firmicutes bacterium]|nr:ABC transporter permease [Bacillota bacterium]